MPIPERSFLFSLTRLASRYKTELAQGFATAGYADVTPDYWIVIECLLEEENISLGQLAQRTNKDNGAITRIVGGMERNDLVVRTASASDRRSFQMSLTKYAHSIAPTLKQIEIDILKRSTEGLNPIEVKELIRMVEHLFDRLNR